MKFIGYSAGQPQEFDPTYELFLDVVHPEDRAAVDSAYSSSVREGRVTYEIEHRIVRKSTGEIRTLRERCDHVRDTSGTIIRSVGMTHDITERREMEEALKKAHAELEQQVDERTAELRKALMELKALKDRLEKENIFFRQENKKIHRLGNILNFRRSENVVIYCNY